MLISEIVPDKIKVGHTKEVRRKLLPAVREMLLQSPLLSVEMKVLQLQERVSSKFKPWETIWLLIFFPDGGRDLRYLALVRYICVETEVEL